MSEEAMETARLTVLIFICLAIIYLAGICHGVCLYWVLEGRIFP